MQNLKYLPESSSRSSVLSGLQCNLSRVELDVIKFAVLTFAVQFIIIHNEKNPTHLHVPKLAEKKADDSLHFLLCLFTSKRDTIRAQCSLVAVRCILVVPQCIPSRQNLDSAYRYLTHSDYNCCSLAALAPWQ